MSIPKYNEFMKPILNCLNDNVPRSRVEIYDYLIKYFKLTEEELEEKLPIANQYVYRNRIGWALTYLKKAGLIDRPKKAVYQITELGISVVVEDPIEVNKDYLKRYESFNEFVSRTPANDNEISLNDNSTEIENNDSPQDVLDKAYKTISISLIDEVLQEVMNQSPSFFEKLVVDLLVGMGYGGSKIENSQVLGKTGDEGIDGIIKEDKLGFDKIYIQAKRWDVNSTVGRPEIQKFMGALMGQGAVKGAFITTSKFSKEAKEFVNKQLTAKIVLIDGNMLANYMIENNIGVSIDTAYYIKKIDRDYFEED